MAHINLLTWALIRIVAVMASIRECELASPLVDEEEEEEEVVVKSKVKRESLEASGEESQSTNLETHIDTSPNGDLSSTITLKSLTLEVADEDSNLEGDSIVSSQIRLWDSNGEFGLSGQFKIQGVKKTLMLEDDMLQWYQKDKEKDKGIIGIN